MTNKKRLLLIWQISIGYDGYRTTKGLKSLIDEIRCIANGAEPGHSSDCKQERIKIKKATCKCSEFYKKYFPQRIKLGKI